MKIELPQMPKTSERSGKIPGGVVLAPRMKKVSEMIDQFGNVIDPVTKQVIRRNGDK